MDFRGVFIAEPEVGLVGDVMVHKLALLHLNVGVTLAGCIHIRDYVDRQVWRMKEERQILPLLGLIYHDILWQQGSLERGARFTPDGVCQVVAGPVIAPVTRARVAGLGLLAPIANQVSVILKAVSPKPAWIGLSKNLSAWLWDPKIPTEESFELCRAPRLDLKKVLCVKEARVCR